jgi:transposase-like protein
MTRRDRRFFSDEFILEAAMLVVDLGHSVNEACQAFDVGGQS